MSVLSVGEKCLVIVTLKLSKEFGQTQNKIRSALDIIEDLLTQGH